VRRLAPLLLLLPILAACGGSDGATAAADATTSSSAPAHDTSRLVVLNGDLTEVVYALGLGDHVVATDSSATYPPAAVALPKIGYQRSLSAEGVISQRPTLVLGNQDAGPPAVLEHLRTAGIDVVIVEEGHDLDAPAAKIRAVGKALGVEAKAKALATSVQARLDAVAAEGAKVEDEPRVATLYLRGANTQLLFGDDQGVDVIAAAVGATPAVASKTTIPLTPEALVEARPDALIVTTTGLESVGGIDGLLKIPGVAETPAGKARRVLAYDDQMLLGFGPRLADCLEQLLHDLHEGTR